ncbi:hypothetical protein BC830DRAFT_1126166 [Chytriomyces sp. MP71]|nr:hypothetical protein BC830DRAFT_1126166 [Chytriomyces sp. MP71]
MLMTPRCFFRSRASQPSFFRRSVEPPTPHRAATNNPASSTNCCTPPTNVGTEAPSTPAATHNLVMKEASMTIAEFVAFKNASVTGAVKTTTIAGDASTPQEASTILTASSSGSCTHTGAQPSHNNHWTHLSDIESNYDPDDAYQVLDVLWDNQRDALLARGFAVERVVERVFNENEMEPGRRRDGVQGSLGYLLDGHMVGTLLCEVGKAYEEWKLRA